METQPHANVVQLYTESTPNPASIKFVANRVLNPAPAILYTNRGDAITSPLAAELFQFPFVQTVFFAANFITITKSDITDWQEIMTPLRDFIKGYLEEGKPVFNTQKPPAVHTDGRANINGMEQERIFTEMETKIASILEEYIRPAVESDGGAILLKSFQEGVVTVQMQGSCSGCPSSNMTLKAGIEGLLKRLVPEVKTVIAEQA